MQQDRLIMAIVDDDADVRRAIERLLRSHGHDVRTFASAEAYLSNHGDADCAILDIELPGLSGLELEERMRHDGRGTPVVFITAHDDMAARARAHQPAAPFLRKPLDEGGLLDAIARVTDHRH